MLNLFDNLFGHFWVADLNKRVKTGSTLCSS